MHNPGIERLVNTNHVYIIYKHDISSYTCHFGLLN